MPLVFLANLAAAGAALSAGASVVATRFVAGDLDPALIAFMRYAIAAPMLAPLLIAHRGSWPAGRDLAAVGGLGVIFFGLFPWSFSAALAHIPAGRGSVGLAAIPVATLLLASAFGRERLTKLKAASVLAAFAGIFLAFGTGAFGEGAAPDHGDLLMLLAVLCGAFYSAFAAPLLGRFGPLFVTALAMWFGLALLTPLVLAVSDWQQLADLDTASWAALFFLGTVGGALQFALYTWALRWISPSRTAIYLTLNPLAAMLLASIFLRETITPELIAGAGLVAAGIILANRSGNQRPR